MAVSLSAPPVLDETGAAIASSISAENDLLLGGSTNASIVKYNAAQSLSSSQQSQAQRNLGFVTDTIGLLTYTVVSEWGG